MAFETGELVGKAESVEGAGIEVVGSATVVIEVEDDEDLAGLVEQEFLKEAELLRTEGLTAEELKRAKAKIIGQKKIARQDLGGYAMSVALDELYGLGYQHIDAEDALYEAVTLAQTQAVAKKHLRPESLVVATVKPAG